MDEPDEIQEQRDLENALALMAATGWREPAPPSRPASTHCLECGGVVSWDSRAGQMAHDKSADHHPKLRYSGI